MVLFGHIILFISFCIINIDVEAISYQSLIVFTSEKKEREGEMKERKKKLAK